MSSGSDDSLGGHIRSYADRMRAEALEKAAELTGTFPPPWVAPRPPTPPESMPPPAAIPLPSAAPPVPESPASPQLPVPTSTMPPPGTLAPVPDGADRVEDGIEVSELQPATVAVDDDKDRVEAGPAPVPDLDQGPDHSTVAELEEIIEDTRDELRQWKQELRLARRDMRRERRYERRFGSA